MEFKTEYEFTLPKGFADKEGNLHTAGAMRLATAADEILPLKDPRVQQNPAYLNIILFSRVVTQLGQLQTVSTQVIEGLFASDLAYLQDLYRQINGDTPRRLATVCPACEHEFDVEVPPLGE